MPTDFRAQWGPRTLVGRRTRSMCRSVGFGITRAMRAMPAQAVQAASNDRPPKCIEITTSCSQGTLVFSADSASVDTHLTMQIALQSVVGRSCFLEVRGRPGLFGGRISEKGLECVREGGWSRGRRCLFCSPHPLRRAPGPAESPPSHRTLQFPSILARLRAQNRLLR